MPTLRCMQLKRQAVTRIKFIIPKAYQPHKAGTLSFFLKKLYIIIVISIKTFFFKNGFDLNT